MRNLLGLFACLFLLYSPSSSNAEIMDRIIASIGDDAITYFDVEKEGSPLFKQIVSTIPQEKQAGKLKEARKKILENLLEKVLLLREAKKSGIEISEKEVTAAIEKVKKENKLSQENLLQALAQQGITYKNYKEELKGQITRQKVIDRKVRSVINISDEDILIHFERNKENYATDDEVKAAHILFLVPKDADKETLLSAKNRASDVLLMVRRGDDFESLAKKHSEGPSASGGGDLGFFKREDMVKEFSKAAFKLKEGEISDLVLTPFGYHIIKVSEIKSGKELPFDEISKKIRARLYNEEFSKEIKEFIERLKEEENVKIRL